MTEQAPNAPSAPKRRPGRPPTKKPLDAAAAPAAAPERPAMRPEDSRADAAKRAAEILGNFDGTEMSNDDFAAPAPPDGWTYEWKVKTVLNQEDPARMMGYLRTGWENVPCSRHPEMMPVGYKGDTIERKGQILMQRPKEITDRFKERDRQAAKAQVRTKEEQLNAAPQGQFERKNKDASLGRISKGYEPMPVPGDK